jgi:hypothetical protein
VRGMPEQGKERGTGERAQAPNCSEDKKRILCTYLDSKSGEAVRLFPGIWWRGLKW